MNRTLGLLALAGALGGLSVFTLAHDACIREDREIGERKPTKGQALDDPRPKRKAQSESLRRMLKRKGRA